MKRSWLWQLLGFAAVSLGGTLLHYLYDWLDRPYWIAPFSGVNESTWEHMKLLFWPMLIFAAIEWIFTKDREDFWCIKLRSILLGLFLIPAIFYGYNSIVAKSPDWLNILIFFIAAAIAYLYEAKKLKEKEKDCNQRLAIAILLLIGISFGIFTFHAPHLGIFLDPITGTYGI